MDILGLIDVPVWIAMVICIFFLIYGYGKYPGTIWKRLGVPSPPSTLFFGHTTQLFNLKNPMYQTLDEWTKQYGKIFGLLFFREPVLVVTDQDALKQIFVKDFNNFTDHYITCGDSLLQPLMQKTIFFNKGEDWRRIRRIMTPAFSTVKLKNLTHYMNASSRQLVDVLYSHIESGTNPETKPLFSAFSLDTLARTVFGMELNIMKNMDNSFCEHAKAMVAPPVKAQILMAAAGLFPFFSPVLKFLRLGFIPNSEIQYFEELLKKLIVEKKDNPQQVDLFQLLINAESDSADDNLVGKKLTQEEIIAQGIIFIFGGYDTFANGLQWLAYELARNQNVQTKVRAEIDEVVGDEKEVGYEHCMNLKYMEAVINETMRMYPPLSMLTRLHTGKSNTTVCGVPVPSDAAVVIPIYNIGRDPELFEDPSTFNPDRYIGEGNSVKPANPMSFLTFGSGHRQCLGQRQVMLQYKICLVHLLRAVCLDDVTPKEVAIEDITGSLVPRQPLRLSLKHR